jgi:hypothetical protein
MAESTVIGRNSGYATGTACRRSEVNLEGRTPVGNLDLVFESEVFLKNLE